MRQFLFTALFVPLSIFGFSQTMEPAIISSGKGTVFMLDGSQLEGEITFNHTWQMNIKLNTPDGEQKIKFKEMNGFVIGDERYTKISSGALSLGDDQIFAKCLTPENFKISIYEHISQGVVGTNYLHETERSYFVKFPSDEKIRSLNDVYFTPFNKKVSKLVEDCPALSKKILDKENDYKLGMISTPELKLELFLRIANEYQQCN